MNGSDHSFETKLKKRERKKPQISWLHFDNHMFLPFDHLIKKKKKEKRKDGDTIGLFCYER